MIDLADRFPEAKNILQRALNQAVREILLLQQSDWAFMMASGTATEYAKKRFAEHTSRFNSLYQSIISEHIPERWLREIEDKDRIFQGIDYRVYRTKNWTIRNKN
jgi:1,4-alpha-glucan branching enzyme